MHVYCTYEINLSFVYIFSFNIDWLIFLQIQRWDLFVCRNNFIEQVLVFYEQSQPHLSWTFKLQHGFPQEFENVLAGLPDEYDAGNIKTDRNIY